MSSLGNDTFYFPRDLFVKVQKPISRIQTEWLGIVVNKDVPLINNWIKESEQKLESNTRLRFFKNELYALNFSPPNLLTNKMIDTCLVYKAKGDNGWGVAIRFKEEYRPILSNLLNTKKLGKVFLVVDDSIYNLYYVIRSEYDLSVMLAKTSENEALLIQNMLQEKTQLPKLTLNSISFQVNSKQ